MNLTAEIFAIGSELCFGRIYDTNSFWMANELTKLGIHVRRITCLTDDVESIVSSLKDSLSRKPTFMFLSGGLGPTDDDLTIEALSQVTGLPKRLDSDALRWMAEKDNVPLEQRDKRLNKMAMSLVGAEVLRNPVGWAPLTYLKFGDTDVYALPGPPAELKRFFNQYIVGAITKRTERKGCSARYVVTMYEEELSSLIGKVTGKDQDVYIKALVSEYKPDTGLPVEILAFGNNDKECQQKMEKTVKKLTELVSGQGKTLRQMNVDCDDP